MASGLGGLLATGQTTKKQATAGLLQSARLEAQQDIAQQQLDMQKEAGIQQAQGTIVGIGGAIGAKAAAGAITKGAGFAANAGPAIAAAATPIGWAVAAALLFRKIFD
jgi:hypothetical protein